ncbi:MAG: hypothetical protein AMXMBFR78_14510 [Rubrivivax sp.]|jgi:MYXO-CTERM domain-containing protein
MKKRRPTTTLAQGLLALSSLWACSLPAHAAVAIDEHWTFDDDAQGWTVAGSATLAHQSDGGAGHGGYLLLTDTNGSDEFSLELPAGAGGDWSRFVGGSFSFDARNVSGHVPDWGAFGAVQIRTAGGGSLTADLIPLGQPPADGQWHRYTIKLDEASFGGGLRSVLADVQGLSLMTEFHQTFGSDFESLAIDNIRVSAVPEPAATALWGLGLFALAARWRRRRRTRC